MIRLGMFDIEVNVEFPRNTFVDKSQSGYWICQRSIVAKGGSKLRLASRIKKKIGCAGYMIRQMT
jgi:hypothetical protein